MSLGFAVALLVIAFVREVLGNWSIAGVPISETGFAPMKVMVMAPGAFFTLAIIIWVIRGWTERTGEDKH